MKKLYKLGLASVLALSLAACSSGGTTEEPTDDEQIEDVTGLDDVETDENDSVPTTGDGIDEEDAEDADAETDADADDAETDADADTEEEEQ
ncbi:hypothetical protein BEP19_04480 [Ammoniphilus oxalaticus]|uniref:DNA primase n=1 Tax=Ammoniphilus oxalaticus TaxID=66863 RepID=A0A419SM70_9BACL|nr:hypothetical protein [Ammoniphilus oxalaticus]RKD25082.1 hypothetical protein BEP19_04480 [Ammoniphilus oxalaticus]